MTVCEASLRGCASCGLIQTVPAVPAGMRACCARCGSTFPGAIRRRAANSRTAAIATAALVLYPLAVSLPLIRIEQFGHQHEASILEGVTALLGRGQLIVGIIVLLCSVVVPVVKLAALLVISAGEILRHRHRAMTFRLIEWTGRYGMLDVLLVAILVAVLKLGDMVEVSAGPGLLAFTCCVVLSLLAAASFDPRGLWEPSP